MFDAEDVLFGKSTINRCAHERATADTLQDDPNAVALVFWRGKALFEAGDEQAPRLSRLPMSHAVLAEAAVPPIYLGRKNNAPVFAYDISAWEDPEADQGTMGSFVDTSTNSHPALTAQQNFLDLRATMGRLAPEDAGEAAAAKGIFAWHDTHGFCARCGAATEVAQAGWQRSCAACGAQHFPRTDPVVIMLITHGDRMLVGRSPAWPEGMVSLLAGFMEPGETVEAAVRREVLEETNVPVGKVTYLSSQPWPFPASLMIGCRGEASGTEITVDPKEIEEAFWVTREEVMAERNAEEPRFTMARKGAIAHFLIEHWLAGRIS